MDGSAANILWDTATVLAREAAEVRSSRATDRALPPLLFFTDPDRTPRPWETAARLPAGAAVIYRSFGSPDAREIAKRLRETTRRAGVLLFIGLDTALADEVAADGVHLPGRAMDHAPGLRTARPDWILTGAVHSGDHLNGVSGLDAAVLSPVFPAGGASASRPPLGPGRFSEMVRMAPCPVYALGGIDAGNARLLVGSGACGLAGVSAIQAAFA